jgi:hypothetical protein
LEIHSILLRPDAPQRIHDPREAAFAAMQATGRAMFLEQAIAVTLDCSDGLA